MRLVDEDEEFTDRRPDLAARLEAGGGSFSTYKTQAELATEKYGVDFSGGVSWLTSDDYKTGSGRTYHNTDLDYKLGYSMNLGYNFNEENRLGALLMGTRNEKAGSSNELRQNDRTAYSDRNNYSADLVYDGGYKNLGLKDKLPTMTEDEQIALLASDGMLVKRPLLVGDDFVLPGFKPAEWENALL